ncbi:MAG: glycine cleavage system protein GcvH [Anaerolineae bacterium]
MAGNVPGDRGYTKDHEWAKTEGQKVRVGITEYAQAQLGDVVYVELPQVGKEIRAGKTFGVVESVKAASDLYSPVTGTVVEVNSALESSPETVNSDPYGDGWMIVVEPSDAAELDGLISAADYEKLTAEA